MLQHGDSCISNSGTELDCKKARRRSEFCLFICFLHELGANKCFINNFLLSDETFWLCHCILIEKRNKQLLCIHAVLIGHQSFSYRKGEGLFEGIANNNNNKNKNKNKKQTKNKNKTKRKNIILQCHPLC
jgi:hypothetical protein